MTFFFAPSRKIMNSLYIVYIFISTISYNTQIMLQADILAIAMILNEQNNVHVVYNQRNITLCVSWVMKRLKSLCRPTEREDFLNVAYRDVQIELIHP